MGLQVTLEVAFPHQHRFHLTWEGEQNSLYKVCVAGWSHDCVDVPGPEYTVEEDLPSGSVFTFFVMDAAEPDDFSSFVTVFYPKDLMVEALEPETLEVSWHPDSTLYIKQVGNVSVDNVTSVKVPIGDVIIEHTLNCGVTDEQMHILPLLLDLQPVITGLDVELVMNPSRNDNYFLVSWHDMEFPTIKVCLSGPLPQCWLASGGKYHLVGYFPSGSTYTFYFMPTSIEDFSSYVTVYYPCLLCHWQLVVLPLTSSKLLVSWDASESPLIKQVSDVDVTGETSVELDFEGSYARVTIFNTLSGNTTDSLYSPLQLYVFIPSLAEEPYLSLPWECPDTHACEPDTQCVPGTFSLLPDLDANEEEFPYSCRGQLINDTCYVYINEERGFHEARRECLALGGDLAYFTPEVGEWLSDEDINEAMWCLGTSLEARPLKPLAPKYILTPGLMSVDGASPCYSFSATSNNSCLSKMPSLCAFSPQANLIPETGTPSEAPPCKNPNPCLNGGICYTTFTGLGLASSENATGHMCHCLDGYYGLSCEYTGANGVDYHKSNLSELVALEGNTLNIEYVWYGVHSNFTHCYTPAALTLFQLRAREQLQCVRERPAPPPSFLLSSTSPPSDAKLECNSQGGDLATHTDMSIFCDLTEDSSIWVQSSSASDEIHGFSFMAVGATKQICPSLQPSMSDSRGMCNYPLTDTFKMSATLILGLNKTTTGVEVSWDEQPGADTYILCVINCISLPGSTTEYFWQTVDSGTRRTFTLTPLINGVSLPRSSVSIYHPWQLSVVAGEGASVVVSWEPLYSSFKLAMASVSYSGEGYAVVEGVEEDVFNLIFVNSKDSEVLEVEAHILRRAGTVSVHTRPWVMVEGSVQKVIGLNSLLPDINPARAFTFLTTVFEDQVPELEGQDLVSNSSLDITYADFATSDDFDDPEYCSVRSARALIRYACQGKTSCSLPKDLLASYTHPPPTWENLCSNTNASYRLFLRAGEMSDDIECPDLEDLHVNRHTEDRTCYGLTRSTLGFQEAREVCLSYGGDLLHYHDRLRTWLDGAWSGALEAGDKKTWVIGYSSTPRQLKPMIPPHLLHPATLANGSVEVCQESNCDLQHHFGICQLPPYTSDIRQTNTTYNEPCSQNICQNGGTCFTTLSGEQMCSCLPSLYGYSCENKGNESETFMKISRVYDPEDSYELTAPAGKLIIVEYAMVGRPLSTALRGRQGLPSAFQGCYSSHSHHLFARRCNGRSFCQLSARDLRHELETACPPMITPVVEVRWSFADSVEVCTGEGEYLDLGSGIIGCFLVTTGEHESASAAREECLQGGGDLASAADIKELCNIASEISTETTLWVSADGDFWSSNRYSASIDDPRLLNSVSCSAENTAGAEARGLCVYPSYRGEAQKYCKKDEPRPDRYPGYTWNETEAGLMATNKCPKGWTGYASRWCSNNGTWDDFLDLSECKSADLGEWEAQTANDSITASEIMNGVAQDTEGMDLAPGDILALGHIFELLETKHEGDLNSTEDAALLAEEYMEGSSATGDHMLRDPESWKELDQGVRGDTSTKLQVGITSAALSLATHLSNFTKSYVKDKISRIPTADVRVSSHPPEFYEEISERSFSYPDGITKIELPKGFQTSSHGMDGLVPVIFNAYGDLHCTSNSQPELFERTLPLRSQQYRHRSTVVRHGEQYDGAEYILGSSRCVWWDEQQNGWNDTGCQRITSTHTYTECSCDHLTNLAVIMDINGVIQKDSTLYLISQWITIVGFSVSIPSLLLSVLCLLCFRSVRVRKSSIIHANLCLNLLIAEIVLLAGLDATHNAVGCAVVAAILHYFFLATFTWSAIEAFHMYLNFIKVFSTMVSPLKYYLGFGYGIPTLFVSITLGVTQGRGYGSERACWLDGALIWAFAGPLAFVVTSNLVAFGMIMRVVWCDKGVGDLQRRRSRQQLLKRLKGSVSLFLLLGVTWISGFLYFAEATSFMAIVFTILNAFQGLGIFILTIITDNKILQEIKKLFGRKVDDPKTSYTSRTTTVVN
ncbi:putative latrophilin Cirl-like isoform X7 [Penaeus vannamei]|uniref:Putative latrophilin Cirl-like isoform X7 n=1 Tax=Penaeus vannamei TaxID=6689 RepID=A0A3R7MGK4_PENVA|nr:putative latrophilin Cirl-like isoform X7 [Penaeus vannamei]